MTPADQPAQPVRTWVLRCGAAMDATGLFHRPATLAIRGGRILWLGGDVATPADLPGPIEPLEPMPERLIVPAMVNAHAHLDLTDLGPQPYSGEDFVAWIGGVIRQRPTDELAIASAVRRGLHLSRESGVGWIGDVCGGLAAIRAHHAAGLEGASLAGVAYLEATGIGRRREAGLQRLAEGWRALRELRPPPRMGWGISPHAPYSTDDSLYRWAAKLQSEAPAAGSPPLCTHLAESHQEDRFVREGSGPFAELLHRLGLNDGTPRGRRVGPIEAAEPWLRAGRWLLVHMNLAERGHAGLLHRCKASVVYCPTASAYFGLPKPGGVGHPYRALLEAGVNVCLGTDSILCQDPSEPQPLGILPQMRLLHRRDGIPGRTLLRMATLNGLRALGQPERHGELLGGSLTRFCLLRFDPTDPADPLEQALSSDAPAESMRLESSDPGLGVNQASRRNPVRGRRP